MGGPCAIAFILAFVFFLLQPAKVTAHWHKGTAFMIKFEESVIARDKLVEGR